MNRSKLKELIKESIREILLEKTDNVAKSDRNKKLADQCSIGEDKDGFYAYTHRARSKSYPTQDKIPVKDIKFINSTS